jgi:Family of unknown function (DUF6152)
MNFHKTSSTFLNRFLNKENAVKNAPTRGWTIAILFVFVLIGLHVMTALSHHSFAMYDQTKTITLTGVAHQFVAQANHAELHFYLVGADGKLAKGADGKYVDWGVEMAGAAAVAQQGITAETFPVGTIFSVKINPLRDGSNFGSRVGAIAKCPAKTPPAAGKHCDSVPGATILGGTAF